LLCSSRIKELVVTNTVPVSQEKLASGKVRVLSIAPLLAKVINSINGNQSVSQIFREEHMVFPV